MKIIDRMKRAVNRRKSEVILTRDFARLGSRSAVSKALSTLVKEGFLYKMGEGVYAKTEEYAPGKFIPRWDLRDLAGEALERLGIPFELGETERLYNAGSTQVPARVSFEVYKRKITRKIGLGKSKVVFENKLEKL